MFKWRRRSLAYIWCVSSLASAQTPTPQTPATASGPHKYALLIGINNYRYSNPLQGFPNLKGCLNDIKRMRQTLMRFGFDPNNIRLLQDSQASHNAILQAIHDQLAVKALPGDIVVLHFSGHGSQIASTLHINQLDETLVAYDSRNPSKPDDPTGGDITGQELNQAISLIKTKHITVIVDSCHSGGLIGKGISTGLSRKIPPFKPTPNTAPAASITVASLRANSAPFVLIAAAQPDQNAQEYTPPGNKGTQFGALTFFLTSEIQSHLNQAVTYRDIFPAVREEVRAAYPDQMPSLEGTNQDEAVFSDQSILVPPYLEVIPGPSGTVTLNAGEAQGMTTGSSFEIFPPDTHIFSDKTQRLTSAKTISTDAYTSVAKLAPSVSIPVGSRATETNHVYPNTKFKVFLDGVANSPDLQVIERSLASVSNIEPSRASDGAKIRITETDDLLRLYSADSGKVLTTLDKGNGLTDRSLAAIALWAKWFNVLSIVNSLPTVNVRVGIIVKSSVGQEVDASVKPLVDKQKFRIKFENLSDTDLYFSVVDLREDGGVQTVYQSGVRALGPGASYTTSEFQASLPTGKDSFTDILKVFATGNQIDLGFLNQSADGKGIKGPRPRGAQTPLGQLLAQSGLGYSRNIDAVPSGWVTVERVLAVEKLAQSSPLQ